MDFGQNHMEIDLRIDTFHAEIEKHHAKDKVTLSVWVAFKSKQSKIFYFCYELRIKAIKNQK